jgi:subtilase family serine protease
MPTDIETRATAISGTSYAAPIVGGIVARLEERTGSSSPEYLWSLLQQDAAHAATAIDPVTGNNMIVNLANQQTCNPPLP